MDTFCPLFTTMSNIYEIVSIIYNFFWSYLTSCLHRFLLYFFLLFLIYLNSIFHKVVNMRHFSTHPYSKRKNNWILKISFLESPCSILSSYILFFFFFDLIGLGLILIISVKLPQYCIKLRQCCIQAQKFFVKFFLIVL